MIKEAIGVGSTIEQAKEDAVFKLGLLPETDYQFEIIELPKQKTLGIFGGNPAKVRVFIEVKQEAYDDNAKNAAVSYLRNILDNLGLSDAEIIIENTEDAMVISLEGDNLGVVIGRHGETLDALQYLCSIIANSGREDYIRVTLDIGDYRKKRVKTLEALAKSVAARAEKMGRNQVLEPMNPYERRVIHTAIQEIDGISSWSVGEGSGRRVVVGVKKGEGNTDYHRDQRRDQRRGTGSEYGRDRGDSFRQRSKQQDRQPKKDLDNAPLYGRIDK